MKCYTFSGGRVSKGIAVREDSKLGLVVFLGEEGRGRRYEKVGLFRKNPAEVKDGRVYKAHPVKITINRGTDRERSFFTLAEPNNGNDRRVLVRINTQWVYTRNTAGSWKAVKGEPQDLVVGYGAHGIAGRIGNWDDGLVLMSPGDVIRVKPEGGYKTKPYALFYDSKKGLQCMPFEDYENMSAAESEDAEVEPL